jgi:molybdate transport system substrate-binding protein
MRLKSIAGKIRSRLCYSTALVTMVALIGAWYTPQHTVLTLSVAASMQEAITEAEAVYQRGHADVEFRNNFGGSGALVQQIESGAPVDAFFSAASKPMDDLQANGLVAPGTRCDLLLNTLVLIAPRDSQLRGFEGLTDKSVRLIALGDPGSVPAGRYGQQTLTALHLFDQLKSKLVLAKDVRQVLAYVETGNADAGIVYATDAETSNRVRVVATAPDSSHDRIVYPAAVVKTSHNEEAARRFIEFLASPAAKAIFIKHGFTVAQ